MDYKYASVYPLYAFMVLARVFFEIMIGVRIKNTREL